jgi:hypothetical protein
MEAVISFSRVAKERKVGRKYEQIRRHPELAGNGHNSYSIRAIANHEIVTRPRTSYRTQAMA